MIHHSGGISRTTGDTCRLISISRSAGGNTFDRAVIGGITNIARILPTGDARRSAVIARAGDRAVIDDLVSAVGLTDRGHAVTRDTARVFGAADRSAGSGHIVRPRRIHRDSACIYRISIIGIRASAREVHATRNERARSLLRPSGCAVRDVAARADGVIRIARDAARILPAIDRARIRDRRAARNSTARIARDAACVGASIDRVGIADRITRRACDGARAVTDHTAGIRSAGTGGTHLHVVSYVIDCAAAIARDTAKAAACRRHRAGICRRGIGCAAVACHISAAITNDAARIRAFQRAVDRAAGIGRGGIYRGAVRAGADADVIRSVARNTTDGEGAADRTRAVALIPAHRAARITNDAAHAVAGAGNRPARGAVCGVSSITVACHTTRIRISVRCRDVAGIRHCTGKGAVRPPDNTAHTIGTFHKRGIGARKVERITVLRRADDTANFVCATVNVNALRFVARSFVLKGAAHSEGAQRGAAGNVLEITDNAANLARAGYVFTAVAEVGKSDGERLTARTVRNKTADDAARSGSRIGDATCTRGDVCRAAHGNRSIREAKHAAYALTRAGDRAAIQRAARDLDNGGISFVRCRNIADHAAGAESARDVSAIRCAYRTIAKRSDDTADASACRDRSRIGARRRNACILRKAHKTAYMRQTAHAGDRAARHLDLIVIRAVADGQKTGRSRETDDAAHATLQGIIRRAGDGEKRRADILSVRNIRDGDIRAAENSADDAAITTRNIRHSQRGIILRGRSKGDRRSRSTGAEPDACAELNIFNGDGAACHVDAADDGAKAVRSARSRRRTKLRPSIDGLDIDRRVHEADRAAEILIARKCTTIGIHSGRRTGRRIRSAHISMCTTDDATDADIAGDAACIRDS